MMGREELAMNLFRDEIFSDSMRDHYRLKTAFKLDGVHPELGIRIWDHFHEKLWHVPSMVESVNAKQT